MKHSAPLGRQQSSWVGLRIRSLGHVGVVGQESGLRAGGGGLSGPAVFGRDTDTALLHNLLSQKPVQQKEKMCHFVLKILLVGAQHLDTQTVLENVLHLLCPLVDTKQCYLMPLLCQESLGQ